MPQPLVAIRWLSRPGIAIDPLIGTEDPLLFPTRDIVSVFRLLVGESSWGPRMEHLLRYGVLSLLADREPRCLRDLRRLFLDEKFRGEVTDGLESESLREFWELEFPSIPEAAANPILNKLSAFLAPMSHLERVFSARENDLDFTAILDSGKILVVNLAKGVLGEEPAARRKKKRTFCSDKWIYGNSGARRA